MFKRRPLHLSAGWLSLVELIVLAPAAGILVFGVVPSAFDVEWNCLGGFGVARTEGDSYLAGFATIMAFGWLLVLVGIVYAEIADNRRAAAALPAVWFAALVALSIVWAAAIGPERCPVASATQRSATRIVRGLRRNTSGVHLRNAFGSPPVTSASARGSYWYDPPDGGM